MADLVDWLLHPNREEQDTREEMDNATISNCDFFICFSFLIYVSALLGSAWACTTTYD